MCTFINVFVGPDVSVRMLAPVTLLLAATFQSVSGGLTREQTIDYLLQASNPAIVPTQDGPAKVSCQYNIISLDSVSDVDMQFRMTMYFRQRWYDYRLNYTELPGLDYLEIAPSVSNKIWTPDLVFDNEINAFLHHVFFNNKLTYIYPTGRLLRSRKVSATFTCKMDHHYFPFDQQLCLIELISQVYMERTVQLEWEKHLPVIFQKQIQLPEFEVKTFLTLNAKTIFPSGKYSKLVFGVHLSRRYGYYVIKIFLPSFLVVILSWLSFWLDVDSVPARISLGLLTVLTLTAMRTDSHIQLARESYIKALDIWVGMCLFFVFAALIEFAYVNITARFEDWFVIDHQLTRWVPLDICGPRTRRSRINLKLDSHPEQESAKGRARRVDNISRILFPATFAVFVTWYVIFYAYSGTEIEIDKLAEFAEKSDVSHISIEDYYDCDKDVDYLCFGL